MRKLILKLWGFVPAPVRIYVIIAGVLAVLGVLGFSVYKIQKWGYDRCENKYAGAIVEHRDASRKEILKADKQYEKIKTEILRIEGDNGIAGPRTEHAIDSMPRPVGSK